MIMLSSSTRFVEANSNAMAAVKLAPLRNSERASATAAYEHDDDAAPRRRAITAPFYDKKSLTRTSNRMSVMRNILMRAFGRPQGILGRLGGIIMASTNEGCGAWVIDLIEVGPNDNVLEVGFGPGVVIQRLSKRASEGYVAGIDPSREMVQQARARNATAIQNGRVDLRRGSVDSLPFDDGSFDKALAVNSMQVWPNRAIGLREMRRVMKPGARIALGFTPYSGQPNKELSETLLAAGFTNANVVERDNWFCALALKP
jgi:SAM-dependent methyltransferase